MGEEICACIQLVDGQDCTVEEIKAYCKGKVGHSQSPVSWNYFNFLSGVLIRCVCFQVSHFKIPRYILFVTSYPLTTSGKVILTNPVCS